MPNKDTYGVLQRAAELAADTLRDVLYAWPEEFDGPARDEAAHIVDLLEKIAAS